MTSYLLGYDASCAACARTGERIKLEAGERLTVLPLQSAQMSKYREEVFGDQAPWAPTLVRVQNDQASAWTGWRMGPALIQAVGVAGSTRILSIVGQEKPRFTHAGPFLRSVGRRPFLKFAAGAVVGALTLTGLSTPAHAGIPINGRRTPGSFFHGTEVAESRLSLLKSRDAYIAFDGFNAPETLLAEIQKWQGLEPVNTADGDPDANSFQVMAYTEKLPWGGEIISVGVYHSASEMIYRAHQQLSNDQIVESGAEVYQLVANRTKIRIKSMSINGSRPEPVAVQDSQQEDPCGGCPGHPIGPGHFDYKKTGTECVRDVDLACVLGFAGCVGCAQACAHTVGVACVFCLSTSCGGFIASGACCPDGDVRRNVCIKCAPDPAR